jgi:hypothetical protein
LRLKHPLHSAGTVEPVKKKVSVARLRQNGFEPELGGMTEASVHGDMFAQVGARKRGDKEPVPG